MKFITLVMIGIIGLFIVNKGVFMHSHKLANGSVISHSHPYNKSEDSKPYKSHHHTDTEFFFFQNLRILFLIIFFNFILFVVIKKVKYSFYFIIRHSLISEILHKGRAPPIS
ncbi:MAG: hypothetical protein GXO80_00110 [Chlorobi bacterium]|nr:hypothetical protein [Chlorobiota bacterium]